MAGAFYRYREWTLVLEFFLPTNLSGRNHSAADPSRIVSLRKEFQSAHLRLIFLFFHIFVAAWSKPSHQISTGADSNKSLLASTLELNMSYGGGYGGYKTDGYASNGGGYGASRNGASNGGSNGYGGGYSNG